MKGEHIDQGGTECASRAPAPWDPGPSRVMYLVRPFPFSLLPQFLHNVSINLKEGGYFIGTVPDGKRINECIKK